MNQLSGRSPSDVLMMVYLYPGSSPVSSKVDEVRSAVFGVNRF